VRSIQGGALQLPSGYVKIAIENGPFIVDLATKNGGSFHSYVNVYQRVAIENNHV
jgi:hypothetical protein